MNAKLDVGRVFSRIFEIYKAQFGILIGAALLLFVPVAIINGFLYDEGGFVLSLIAGAVALVATFWYQGMVVEAARDILDGRRDHSIGSLFSAASPVIAALIGAGILAGIAIAIGFLLLIIPGLFLITIWAVIVPVIVLERTGVLGSFGRSRELVKGNGWQVFGVLVLLFILTFLVRVLISAIAVGISDSIVGYAVAELIVSVLLVPLSALAAAVIYFELKAIKGEPVLAEGSTAPAAAATPASDMPAADTSPTPRPEPGSPPPTAPPPGGSPPAGRDPQPPAGGPQAPPNA